MVARLDDIQPVFPLPPLEDIPDGPDDVPVDGQAIKMSGPLELPNLVFGAAAFSVSYNNEEYVSGDLPFRTVRLALRYGINAFDTSAYYGPSEIILGTALKALEPEFPRSSYKLMTKCGRYGFADFDYSPATIRASVQRSLERLHTTYLDTVYLHDLEFVAERVGEASAQGFHAAALLPERAAAFGLADGEEGRIHGEGDEKVLAAVAELRKLQTEGLVKNVGISGYPLPTLLRIALLVLHTTGAPLDAVLSYSHLNMQNGALRAFGRAFAERARVRQLVAASPLSMGLLAPRTPAWHPAPPALRAVVHAAAARCRTEDDGRGFTDVALAWAYRAAERAGWPMVVGLSTPAEVHASVRAWRDARAGAEAETALEKELLGMFAAEGYADWSWASPP